MAKYMQRFVETTYIDVVIEADSLDEAKVTFDKLYGTDSYSEFLWSSLSDADSEIEEIGVEETDFPYLSLTADQIETMIQEG